jgi:hypothetical protein
MITGIISSWLWFWFNLMADDLLFTSSFYARACASENSRIQFKPGKGASAWTDDHVRWFSSD